LAWLYLMGWVLQFTGRWLHGTARARPLRCVLAWSQIPNLLSVVFWVFLLLAFSRPVITSPLGTLFISTQIFGSLIGFWSFIYLVIGVREVQGFSLARSLVNVILVEILVGVFIGLPAGVIIGLSLR
jgi:hypothetical protein